MKTLDEIPGSWHRTLDSTNGDADGCNSDRFKCVMNGSAVLDLETGLVWQRGVYDNGFSNWGSAVDTCLNLQSGGRNGWRLPSIAELTSLLDLSLSSPYLPAGHPFAVDPAQTSGAAATFWSGNLSLLHSATGLPDPWAFVVVGTFSSPGNVTERLAATTNGTALCVRGLGSTPAQ